MRETLLIDWNGNEFYRVHAIFKDGTVTIGNMVLSGTVVDTLRAALCPPDAATEARKVLEQAVRDGWLEYFCPSYDSLGYTCLANPKAKNRAMYQSLHYPTEAEALTAAAAWVEEQRKPVVPEVEGMELNDIILQLQSLGVKDIDRTHAARWHPYWLGVTLQNGTLLDAERDETVRHFFERALREARAAQGLPAQAGEGGE